MRWKTLTILAWIGFFLLMVEVPLEWRAHRRGWDTPLFGHQEPEGGPSERADDQWGPTADFPFRSRVHPVERTPGVARIWVASASYAMGDNVATRYVFPVRVEDLLRQRGLDCEVLNAGRVGQTVAGNIEELRREGARWKPDLVLLYQMSTDVDNLTRGILAPDVAAAEDAETQESTWFQPGRWLEHTATQPVLKSAISARLTKARVLHDSLGQEGEDRFVRRLDRFLQTVRDLGARPVLSTFAVSHERDHPDDLPLHVYRYNIRLSRQGWHDSLDRWHLRLRQLAAEQGVPLVEVRAAVSGRDDLFVDFVHLTEAGHERVAYVLAKALEPLVRNLASEKR